MNPSVTPYSEEASFRIIPIVNELSPLKPVTFLKMGKASTFTILTELPSFSATLGDLKYVCPTAYQHPTDDIGWCTVCNESADLKCTTKATITAGRDDVQVLVTTAATIHLLESTPKDMPKFTEVICARHFPASLYVILIYVAL